MDKPTVLHVLKSSVYAGAENVAVTLIQGLDSKYHILYTSVDGSIAQKLKEEKIPFKPMKAFSIKELKKIIRETQPDIIHAHDYTAGILCAMLKKRSKLIVHLHHKAPFSHKLSFKEFLFRCALLRIDKVILVSESLFATMKFLKKYRNLLVADNPVDREKIVRLSGHAALKEYDLIFIGRLCEAKNPKRFFGILKQLEKEGYYSAVVTGVGPMQKECIEMAADIQTGSVTMMGYQDNPYKILARSRLLVMTSIEEGYGLAVMEANVLGVPALVTPVGNMEALFGKGAKEICETDEEFCRKIRMLLRDEAQYEIWKQDALLRSEKFEEPGSYAEKIDGIYKELLNGNECTLFL